MSTTRLEAMADKITTIATARYEVDPEFIRDDARQQILAWGDCLPAARAEAIEAGIDAASLTVNVWLLGDGCAGIQLRPAHQALDERRIEDGWQKLCMLHADDIITAASEAASGSE